MNLRDCEKEGRFRSNIFRWLLQEEVDVTEKCVVDLGAGPCHFARIAAESGAHVTAVDGRDERIPDDVSRETPSTESGIQRFLSAKKYKLSRGRSESGKLHSEQDTIGRNATKRKSREITFVLSDVRDFDLESFDVVLIFGLLYHFGVDDQIKLLRRCRGKTVLVDTMVCFPDLVTHYPQFDWQSLVHKEGEYEGWIFPENNNLMASIGNKTSFWHTDPSYGQLFSKCGFSDIVAYRPFYLAKYGPRSFYRLS